MSIFRRLNLVVQQKANHALDAAEDPAEALDLSYEKQLEALQQVRRSVADVMTSEKRVELQAAQLRASHDRLEQQAQLALQQGREDLATAALTRAELAQSQLAGLEQQAATLRTQEQKLEVTAQKLTAKVEAFRTQKETLKAQYSAASASTQAGEAITGLSEQMADVSMMVDRARDKTLQMQARADAVGELMDSGALDTIGVGDDLDSQLTVSVVDTTVQNKLAAMKAQLQITAPATAGALAAPAVFVVRIQGNDQYRLPERARAQIDQFDTELLTAATEGDEAHFRGLLHGLLAFVRASGERLDPSEVRSSDLIVPSDEMSVAEAQQLLKDDTVSAPASR